MIKVTNLHKSFDKQEVLKGVDLEVNKGDVIAILGPSGSGKTTLLRCLNFLEKSDKGRLEFDGEVFDLETMTKKDIQRLRMKTGFVFQSFNLFLNKTVLQNVTEGLIVARKMTREKAEILGKQMLDDVGLSDKYNAYPEQLSGGQQQRAAIARAMVTKPEIVLFDEPTSALDPELTGEVLAIIQRLASQNTTMIVVTHEMNFAKNVSNRVVFMEEGLIIESAETKDFFSNPKTDRAKDFIAKVGS